MEEGGLGPKGNERTGPKRRDGGSHVDGYNTAKAVGDEPDWVVPISAKSGVIAFYHCSYSIVYLVLVSLVDQDVAEESSDSGPHSNAHTRVHPSSSGIAGRPNYAIKVGEAPP